MMPLRTGIVAHGIGGRQDLPVPFFYTLAGAIAALLVSFLAVGLLWRTSRLRGAAAGTPVPRSMQRLFDAPLFRWTLRAAGLAMTGYVAVAAVFGPDDALNPTAGFVYVLFWAGLVPASLLFGPVWRLLNPLRTLHRILAGVLGTNAETGRWPLPQRLGYWPAAAGLVAFTWLELVAPNRTSTAVLIAWFAGYASVHLLAAGAFGSRWFDRGDAFEVFSSLIGQLALIGRRDDGRIVIRNPFNGLDAIQPAPGLVAVVCVMLGTTAYDSLAEVPAWVAATQGPGSSPVALGTVGQLATITLVAVLYWAGTAHGRLISGMSTFRIQFAHSIVPIVVGYLIAHYFSLLVFEGQHTLVLASDPIGTGADLLGTAERGVDFTLLTPTAIATVQVAAVVTGHVVGVIAAHDRGVRLFPPRDAIAGQIPLLVLMICYTVGGLAVLFAA